MKFKGNQYVSNLRIKIAWYTKRTIATMAVMSALSWATYAGTQMSTKTVYAEKTVTVEVTSTSTIPMLEKIVFCESGGNHYDKNGQVLVHGNTNGSVDEGWGQINLTVWGKKAKLLGYDLSKETDNKEFTKWLFLNYGDSPWSASRDCWSKK